MLPASDENKGRSVESNHRTEHWDVVDDNLFGGEMIRRTFERVENFVEIISVQIIFLENCSHLGLDGVSIDEKEVENIFCIPSHDVSTRVVIEIAVLQMVNFDNNHDQALIQKARSFYLCKKIKFIYKIV